MLTIALLAQEIERVLPILDIAVLLPRKRRYVSKVPLASLLSAVIWYSSCGITCWKKFVRLILPFHLSKYRLSYSRWSFWRVELANLIEALAAVMCIKQGYRGVSLVDATALPVCSIQRERDQKCYTGTASKGRSSLGWFFGFKLHVICSDTGEILRFWLSTASVHDTAPLFQHNFLRGLQGLLIGDSGYRVNTKKRGPTANAPDLALLARPTGVTDTAFPWPLRKLFKGRWRVETLFGELKDNFGLRASARCRCLSSFKSAVFGSLIAYTLNRRLFSK